MNDGVTAGTVVLDNVSKVFASSRGREPLHALENLSFTADAGEFIAIIGPSGCGKSTLLALIAGYVPANTGHIFLDRQEITGPGPDRVMVFQRPTLFPWLSAADNIGFGLKLKAHRGKSSEHQRSIESLLDLVGLRSFGAHYPYELSGGMQQRVEIARALAVNPRVLLMDEPLGALDALTRRAMQRELLRILRETRQTVFFVTHDIDEAIILANRVVVMSQRPGTIKEIISVEIDRKHPRDHPQFIELSRHMETLLDGTV